MRRSILHVSLVLALGLLGAGCDDGNKNSSGGQDGGNDASTGNDASVGNDAGTDAGEDAGVQCWIDAPAGGKCWSCALPTSPESDSLKFLNRCGNASSSSKFDNATRIPATTWVPGTPLPTLP